jgi:hypothetical protein
MSPKPGNRIQIVSPRHRRLLAVFEPLRGNAKMFNRTVLRNYEKSSRDLNADDVIQDRPPNDLLFEGTAAAGRFARRYDHLTEG